MLSKSQTGLILAVALSLVMVVSGCQQAVNPGSSEEGGDVQISMDLSASAVSVDAVAVTLTHSASSTEVTQSLTVNSASSTASGTISDLIAGSWTIAVELRSGGSVVVTGTGTATVTAGETATATITVTIEDTGSGTGTLEGTVRDATTFEALDGVTVTVEGTEYTTTTGSDGSFTITAPSGSQTLTFSLEGYSFPEITVEVTAGQTVELSEGATVASPQVSSGNVRIVLSWGASPSDLDSHLETPGGQEVYYGNRTPTGAGANLDRDDTSSYGPETITITDPQVGTYRYWVYQFSSTGSLTTSDAEVQLYDSDGLFATYTVPTSGTGRYWNVVTMEYNGSEFLVTVVDQIQSSEPSS